MPLTKKVLYAKALCAVAVVVFDLIVQLENLEATHAFIDNNYYTEWYH